MILKCEHMRGFCLLHLRPPVMQCTCTCCAMQDAVAVNCDCCIPLLCCSVLQTVHLLFMPVYIQQCFGTAPSVNTCSGGVHATLHAEISSAYPKQPPSFRITSSALHCSDGSWLYTAATSIQQVAEAAASREEPCLIDVSNTMESLLKQRQASVSCSTAASAASPTHLNPAPPHCHHSSASDQLQPNQQQPPVQVLLIRIDHMHNRGYGTPSFHFAHTNHNLHWTVYWCWHFACMWYLFSMARHAVMHACSTSSFPCGYLQSLHTHHQGVGCRSGLDW